MPTNILRTASVAALLALAAACSGDPTASVPEERPAVATPTFVMTVEAPGQVHLGETLHVRLVVKNTGTPGPFSYSAFLSGDPAYDVAVRDMAEREVWHRLAGSDLITWRSLSRHLGTNESFVFEAAWDLRGKDGSLVAPGQYRVYGAIMRGQSVGDMGGSNAATVTISP